MPTTDIKKILEEYVATANNPEYKSDFTTINSKFPELKGYDPKLLEEYVATANNEEYKSDFNIINSKFPELFDEKKKGFQTDLGSAYATTSGGSFPKYQGMRLEGSTTMTKKGPRQPSSPSNVDKGTFQQTKQKLSKESPIVKIGAYEGALSIVNQRFNQNLELFNQAKQAGDEQAMAQLQPLLEIDSKKAEGLKKGIDAQKNEANFTEADDIANNFNIGVYRAMGTMMQGPKAFDESMAIILADVAGIPQESVKAYMDNVYPATSSASDKLASAGKFVNKIAEERGQEKNINRSYGGSAYNAL